ncbi:MAG: chromosome segregation protein ScpA, partial [Oscillospiraceae bacterium]|nr:chromosome segregation protein ScpA [Oscillospiraceae bacterium]
MAAHLVYIKTRMLLSIDDEVAVSEMEELMAALEEHKSQETYVRIKDVAEPLAGRYEFGQDYLTKQPELVKGNNAYQYVHNRADILTAIRAVFARSDGKLPPPAAAFEGIVGREPYPVADKARAILERLVQFGVARFRALFKTSRSRSEVVATFLAILELCKANRIHLAGTAEDCTVTSTADEEPGELDVTIESY